MTWWARLFRRGRFPGFETGEPPHATAEVQRAADRRVEVQRNKLAEARQELPGAYRAVDRLGQEVEAALRALRGH